MYNCSSACTFRFTLDWVLNSYAYCEKWKDSTTALFTSLVLALLQVSEPSPVKGEISTVVQLKTKSVKNIQGNIHAKIEKNGK